MPTFTPQALHALTTLIVSRMGSAEEETEEVADHLVRANLAGHDSHGVGMLPAYVRLLQDGLLVPNQTPHTVLDAGALLVIDARRGFGQRMAAEAVRRAIGRARETGACVLALRNCLPCRAHRHLRRAGGARGHGVHRLRQCRRRSRHPGALGLRRAAARHQPVLRRRPGRTGRAGADARHGDHDDRRRQGARRLQQGRAGAGRLLIDADGHATNDPTGFIRDRTGAMLSFGRHKGSGLAVMCEIMAGAIGGGQARRRPSGAAF